jgi:hypothetical protein
VRHHRTVWLRDAYLILVDELEGAGGHSAEATFQLPSGTQAVLDGNRLLIREEFVLSWCATSALDAELRAGGPEPDEGWIAPSLEVRRSAGRLVLKGSFAERLSILTIVADLRVWSRGILATTIAQPGHALLQQIGDRTIVDTVVAASAPVTTAAKYEMDGTIGVWRERAGIVIETDCIGGTFMRPSPIATGADASASG